MEFELMMIIKTETPRYLFFEFRKGNMLLLSAKKKPKEGR
jgi:hypothetical protein